jgi:hypothetical protein
LKSRLIERSSGFFIAQAHAIAFKRLRKPGDARHLSRARLGRQHHTNDCANKLEMRRRVKKGA